MKNLKIIEPCLINREHTPAGTIVENLDTELAAQLVGSGKAVETTDKPHAVKAESEGKPAPATKQAKKKAKGETGLTVVNPDTEPENRDPVIGSPVEPPVPSDTAVQE